MKWADHRRITLEICRFCGITESKDIAEMSILPDKEPVAFNTSFAVLSAITIQTGEPAMNGLG